MGWTGAGFVDEHSHDLIAAAGTWADYGDRAASHRSLAASGETISDVQWTVWHDNEVATRNIERVLDTSARNGLVSITEKGMDSWQLFDTLLEIRSRHELPLRVKLFALSRLASAVSPGGLAARRTNDPSLDICGVKFYVDGWLGTRTCAVREPFSDDPFNTGCLFIDSTTLARRAEPFASAGFQISVHAIGDRAIAEALDAFEKIFVDPATCRAESPIIEHVSVLAPDLVERIAQWGVVACVQPSFGIDDATLALTALGKDRSRCAYDWPQLLRAGARVTIGSDSPFGDARPLAGLQHLATGCAIGSATPIASKIAVAEALSLMTDASAGTVTLSADPLSVQPNEIHEIEVLETRVE